MSLTALLQTLCPLLWATLPQLGLLPNSCPYDQLPHSLPSHFCATFPSSPSQGPDCTAPPYTPATIQWALSQPPFLQLCRANKSS